jgi:hypothetical protein
MPNQPTTIAELGRLIAGADDQRRWLYLEDFLTKYRSVHTSGRSALLEERPPATGDQHWDALLGALAEHLALYDDRPPPDWVEDQERFLDTFWFPENTPEGRAHALVQAPASFMRRGVFVPREKIGP